MELTTFKNTSKAPTKLDLRPRYKRGKSTTERKTFTIQPKIKETVPKDYVNASSKILETLNNSTQFTSNEILHKTCGPLPIINHKEQSAFTSEAYQSKMLVESNRSILAIASLR